MTTFAKPIGTIRDELVVVQAAEEAARHVGAYMTAYAGVGLDAEESFRLYCILAARPTVAIPYEWPRGAK